MANKGKQRYYDINNINHYVYGVKISKRGENALKVLSNKHGKDKN